jgi:hypothetical protein
MVEREMRGNEVTDRLWGTRYYTHGAKLQLPRKVPMRVEPKSYFALERTYLSWMGMAITLGGVSSALVGFSGNSKVSRCNAWTCHACAHAKTHAYLPCAYMSAWHAAYMPLPHSRLPRRMVGVQEEEGTLISSRTIDVITCIYTPLAMIIMVYALFTYEWRARFLRKKQMGFFDDRFGPSIVATLVLLTLLAIFVIALYDFIF